MKIVLQQLPDDVLVLLLSQLPVLPHVARLTGCVSKAWMITGPLRPEIWVRLAQAHQVHMPVATGRELRSEKDPRGWFLRGVKRKQELWHAETEAALTGLLRKLRKGEVSNVVLAKLFPCSAPSPSEAGHKGGGLVGQMSHLMDINHRLSLHSGRSVAFSAAWMGRLRTLQRLVCQFSAALDQEDEMGFTPLAVAAWSGQTKVVTWILASGHPYGNLGRKGVPPMTSSCGGKGPYTILEWVQRKKLPGWQKIEKALSEAALFI
eukprot:CAMPEP_0179439752 /NCGR_PEP_ID=MMETSP0799-20121207/23370_1 /TAXON_ID=46947 /ORGANISM="Geminigera cryophila, Strain CCMP2564" /LENGTH=262 /DNA_ID=CAMNT_0021222453 /DNA_START=18 /DNA_END=806 /DNA_ORIENTATION=-